MSDKNNVVDENEEILNPEQARKAAIEKRRAELQAKEAKRNQRMMANKGKGIKNTPAKPSNESLRKKKTRKEDSVKEESVKVTAAKEAPAKEKPAVKKGTPSKSAANEAPEREQITKDPSAIKREKAKRAAAERIARQDPENRKMVRKPRTEEEKQRIAELRRRKAIQERRAAQAAQGTGKVPTSLEGLSPEEIERRRRRRAKIAARKAAEKAAAEQAALAAETANSLPSNENADIPAGETKVIDAEAVRNAAIISVAAEELAGIKESGPAEPETIQKTAGIKTEADTALDSEANDSGNPAEKEDGLKTADEIGEEPAEEKNSDEDFEAEGEDAEKPEDSGEESESEEEEPEEDDSEEESEEESEEKGESEEKEESEEEDSEEEEESEEEDSEEEEEDSEEEESEEDDSEEEESEEDEESDEEEKPKKKELTPAELKARKRKIGKLIRTITGSLVILAIFYLAGTFYYMNHFYPHTTLNGLNVSNRSVSGVRHKLKSGIKNYDITLIEKDGTEEIINSDELGMYLDWNKELVKQFIMAQPGYDWPARFFDSRKLETEVPMVKCDSSIALKSIAKLPCMSDDPSKQIPPVSATIVKENATKTFVIQDEIPGTVVDPKKLLDAITLTANGLGKKVDMQALKAYMDPDVVANSDELHEKLTQMNHLLDASITYDVGDLRSEVLDRNTFFDWIYIDDEMVIHVDEDPVIQYVDYFADKYDDYGKGKWFNTCYGNRVYIPNNHFGWLMDKTAEVSAIISDIRGGQPVEREAHYQVRANSHDYACWGGTYCEVDITLQHMWCFKDGECVVSSDVVTGNESRGTVTRTGIYQITQHWRDQILVGEDYETPVSYWMGFDNGIGFHDAYWRGGFGGDIYKYSGSHGCVNLPTSAAAALFDATYKGYPVIVYKDSMTEGPAEE